MQCRAAKTCAMHAPVALLLVTTLLATTTGVLGGSINAWWHDQQALHRRPQQPILPTSLPPSSSSSSSSAAAAAGRQPHLPVVQHQRHPPSAQQGCPAGCEVHGNCNRALGLCECPIGYTGPDCSQPLWPSCKASPTQKELYCSSDWRPKSCACLRECAAFVCPDGTPESCQRDFDLFGAKCFERPVNSSVTVDGVAWDGGSDLPEDLEAATYYKGRLRPDATKEISRDELTDVGVVDEVGGEDPLVALPSSSCPLRCHSQGACVQKKGDGRPFCACHWGFEGEFCEQQVAATAVDNICYNRCQGRGTCRRGFCHCEKGWWGKDCSSSRVFAPHSARRPLLKLKVYMYDLPWQVSYQPEYYLGWRYHDHNYQAWRIFGEMFLNDTAVRTENPWEANMFFIPSMTYAMSENTGDTLQHSRRAIDFVRSQWPFFNRSQGTDHFLWLTNDRGACAWPGEEEPALANVIKVVHFGWHHVSSSMGQPAGWEGQIHNKHWGCFHPLRDIVAAPYWLTQTSEANETYLGARPFNASDIPTGRLLFFAGGIRADRADYSQGVRQALWRQFGGGSSPQVLIHQGVMAHEEYGRMLATSKFCLAPSGHGWGIRLSHYIARGCVPVIVQDDIYQPWEGLLPYEEFSVRLPQASIPHIAELLSDIGDAEYRRLRKGLHNHWRAFVWNATIGGQAYDAMIRSLKERMLRLNARHYHPLHHRPHKRPMAHDAAAFAGRSPGGGPSSGSGSSSSHGSSDSASGSSDKGHQQ